MLRWAVCEPAPSLNCTRTASLLVPGTVGAKSSTTVQVAPAAMPAAEQEPPAPGQAMPPPKRSGANRPLTSDSDAAIEPPVLVTLKVRVLGTPTGVFHI